MKQHVFDKVDANGCVFTKDTVIAGARSLDLDEPADGLLVDLLLRTKPARLTRVSDRATDGAVHVGKMSLHYDVRGLDSDTRAREVLMAQQCPGYGCVDCVLERVHIPGVYRDESDSAGVVEAPVDSDDVTRPPGPVLTPDTKDL